MRRIVPDRFYEVNRRSELEGEISHFYADSKGLITLGVGCLVDPLSSAIALPMRRRDGSMATAEEIAADWRAVKSDPLMAKGGHLRAARVVQLHLNPGDVKILLRKKLYEFAGDLRDQFPCFDDWPADAQFGLLSLSWARGQHGYAHGYPHLTKALLARDFDTAALECSLAGGYEVRDAMNKACFEAAARVDAEGLDPEMLFFDAEAPPEAA